MTAGAPKKFQDSVVFTFNCERSMRDYVAGHHLDRLEVFKRGLKLTVPDDTTAIERDHSKAKTEYLKQKAILEEKGRELSELDDQLRVAMKKKEERERLKVDLLYDFLSEQTDPFRIPLWSEDDCGINGWFERKGCPLSFCDLLKMWKEVIE